MLGILDDIKTLDCLKKTISMKEKNEDQNQISTRELECYLEKLCNTPNASQIVTDWMNTLIDEYNKQYKKFEVQEKSFYNKCLYRAFDYFTPFLNTYEKMEILINMCSLVDDEDDENKDFHLKFFESSVQNATEYAEEIHFLELIDSGRVSNGNEFLYLLGFFNFRIQNYETAITFLKPCVENCLKEISNDESICLYIKSLIYLAESYEYISDLDSALKQLIGSDGMQLSRHFNNRCVRIDILRYIFENYSNISQDNNSIKHIKDIYERLCDSHLDLPTSYKVFQLKDVNESLKSFVHVTAHCLSEYAALCMDKVAKKQGECTNEIRIYSLLQQVSRFLMDWLVAQDDSYVTCQATIRAENDACPEAIDILIKRLKGFENLTNQELSVKKKMEKAELQFYIFYFAEQELNINNNKENLLNIFMQYGSEFYKFVKDSKDTNALFHYLVIQFKYLLKKSAQDILQLNSSANYVELDKVYHQICECRKKPLPHVFRELIDESNRLINVYLLLREYRYLFRKDTDSYSMQEFNNRLGLKRYSALNDEDTECEMSGYENIDDEEFNIDDSNIIKKLIDEIEARKRILILSPVKAAPSCSLDYLPVNQLNKLMPCENEIDNFELIYSEFKQVAAEHGKKKGLNKILQCDNIEIVKWMIYYDSSINALFIYYNELIYETKGEMLRANLNENEKSHLDGLFKSMKRNFFHKNQFQVDCNQEMHKRIYESGGVCTTWLVKGCDISGNDKLLEILIFSEFDFYSFPNSHKIDKDDYIMFSTNDQSVAKYKIVCFRELPNTKGVGICNHCVCVDAKEQQLNKDNSGCIFQQITETAKCVYNGKAVDLCKLKNNITERIDELELSGYGEVIALLKDIYIKICKCYDGTCLKKSSEYRCDLIKKCMENGVEIPIQQR